MRVRKLADEVPKTLLRCDSGGRRLVVRLPVDVELPWKPSLLTELELITFCIAAPGLASSTTLATGSRWLTSDMLTPALRSLVEPPSRRSFADPACRRCVERLAP